MSFDTLGLSPALLRALNEQGYTTPTPIQAEAIPLVLAGRDLRAGAQTGTGKTAAFTLPMLERLYPNGQRAQDAPRRVRALVLTPTRELAVQVHDSVRAYGKNIRFNSAAIFGGVGMTPQIQTLRRGVDILVATPGRLIDHLDSRHVSLQNIEILVLDEADRMLDMGFLPALKKILSMLPKVRQNLLFSATYADDIKKLANELLRDPAEVQIAQQNSIAATVTHRVHPVDADRKKDLLIELLAQDSRRQTLVFGRTKHGSDRLARQLVQAGFRADAIHGNKSQGARQRALKDFKEGRVNVLVATDIAARGLDIDQLPVVINYELPMVAADYVHRIGRTGRAGADGLALSLVCRAEEGQLQDILKLLKREIETVVVPGFEPHQSVRTELRAPGAPRPQGKPGGNGSGKPNHSRRGHGHANTAAPKGGKHHPGKHKRGGGGGNAGGANTSFVGRVKATSTKRP